jgi:hypothetical protein
MILVNLFWFCYNLRTSGESVNFKAHSNRVSNNPNHKNSYLSLSFEKLKITIKIQ